MSKIVLIESDRMGRENEELGAILMHNFLYALARAAAKPRAVYLVNDGVRLACQGSGSVDDLFLLVEDGVPVYACGTCLDFLELKDSLRVGAPGTMLDLVAQMLDAEDVLTVA